MAKELVSIGSVPSHINPLFGDISYYIYVHETGYLHANGSISENTGGSSPGLYTSLQSARHIAKEFGYLIHKEG